VLTVWQPLAALPFTASSRVVPPAHEEGFEKRAVEVAAEGVRLARGLGFDAWPLAKSGDPVWRTIVDAADLHDASIVVLGSHGRSGVELVLLGSVAEAVARHTERPVLIARAASGEDGA